MFSFAKKTSSEMVKPKHIAIIMDGNGRWAKARSLPRTAGHKKGADAVREVIETCRKESIEYLTLYAFSSENWNRSEDEVSALMNLLRFYLEKELEKLHKNDVRISILGNRTKLADDINKKIQYAEELTKNNKSLHLNIALSYGSREEIINAVKKAAEQVKNGTLEIDEINEELFCNFLYTSNIPDPDLLIRTSGEKRISNFLLWQTAYTELYFTDTLWPDFGRKDLLKAIEEFGKRERRYGGA